MNTTSKWLSNTVTPFGPVGYITFKRTYARRKKENDANSETEEFPETVERVIAACRDQLKVGFTQDEENQAREMMLSLQGIVAGRFLWQLGTKTVDKLGLLSLQNCAFTLVNEPIRPFTWAMDALMLGSGVGYNIQKEYVYELPKPKRVKIVRSDTKDADFIVPDSREGWVELLRKVLESHFITGKGFSYSTICIRGKGTTIKGFGGLSSGPEDLCWGMEQISKILNDRANKKVRPIDCLDVMNIIGMIVVAGNVRRSAQIAIGDMDDLQFLNAKRWDLGSIPSWRAMSNNSVVCNDITKLPLQFWEGYKGNGEPYGLINLNMSRMQGRTGETQYPDSDIGGFNPSLRAGTRVWTKEFGMIPIEKLQDKSFTVKGLNGNFCKANCWLSSPNAPLYEIKLKGGSTYYATAEHKWAVLNDAGYDKIATNKLMPGMKFPRLKDQDVISYKSEGTYEEGLICGYFYGDGWITDRSDNGKRQYGVVIPNNVERKQPYLRMFKDLYKGTGTVRSHGTEFNSTSERIDEYFKKFGTDKKAKGIPEFVFTQASNKFISGFIQGYFDADGCLSEGRQSVSSKDQKLIKDFQELLGFKGRYYNYNETHRSGYVGANGKHYDKDVYAYQIRRNLSKIGTENSVQIESIKLTNLVEPVWDISVDDKDHAFQLSGCITGNCAEQGLVDKETCCLAEQFLPNIPTYETFITNLKLLYRICKHSLYLPCHLPETQEIVHKNMRMGIGVTGYLQATPEQKAWLKPAYEELRRYDVEYSKLNNFPTSIKLTTVKPSGTLSLLAGTTPGAHAGYSHFHIRRIRMASNIPLVEICRQYGYPVEFQRNFDGSEDRNTVVVSFPCSFPKHTKVAKDMTAIDQLEVVKELQTNWSDNSVSVTIYYRKEELDEIKTWLTENFNTNLKTVSFLLHSDHGFIQAPLEEITEIEYNELVAKVKPITNLKDLQEDGLLDSFECVGGVCPIK